MLQRFYILIILLLVSNNIYSQKSSKIPILQEDLTKISKLSKDDTLGFENEIFSKSDIIEQRYNRKNGLNTLVLRLKKHYNTIFFLTVRPDNEFKGRFFVKETSFIYVLEKTFDGYYFFKELINVKKN